MSKQKKHASRRSITSRFWQFIGRIGLAVRAALTALIWKPFYFITTPPRRLFAPVWRLLGRMGIAIRDLLTLLFLEPIWTLTRPFFTKLWRLLGRMGLAMRTMISILIIRPAQRRWQAGAPGRRLHRRRFDSRWLVFKANWRVRLRRPRPPKTAVFAPRLPRYNPNSGRNRRWLTAVISISIVLIASFTVLRPQQPSDVAANRDGLSRIIIATPSPLPPTPIPSPTAPVRLTPWPTPDPFNKGGTLAFSQRYKGNSDIFALSFGQSYPTRLTSHPAADRQPAWSPDGQSIAFASQRDGNWELYIYDLNLGTLTRVTNDPAYDGNPAWSPDGEWLVYDSYHQNNMDIYVIKVDGSEGPYRLTENAALDYEPTWSPNGRFLSFVSRRSGNPDLFIMSLDSVSDGTAVNLTNTPTLHEESPAFSPDGNYLAYSEASSGVAMLHAIPLDAKVNAAGPSRNLGQQGRWPVWSPDSQTLLAAYNQAGTDYFIGGSINAWGIAPQLYAGAGRLNTISWSAVSMSPSLIENLRPVDEPKPDIPLFTETVAEAEAGQPSHTLAKLPVNAPAPYLSDAVDQSFLALRQRVIDEAGWDFLGRLDGLFEPIQNGGQPGEEVQSWNKAGRAMDIYSRAAMSFDPQVEVVMEKRDGKTYWRIYLRAVNQDGTQGEPLYAIPWDFQARYGDEPTFYEQGGKLKDGIPGGYYVDFTELADDYGWTAVSSQENWRSYFPAIRFWHFENRQGLDWQRAMLQLYSAAELQIDN